MLLKNLEEQYLIKGKDLITKHPLQPFSKKYFDGSLETYDNRWNHKNSINHDSDKSVWKWKIDAAVIEEKRDIDTLYRILSDAPKYFLKIVCDIELPEDIERLCNIEPFIVENGLEKWKLANTILNREDYYKEIKISKFRGELPGGKYADGLIKNIENEAEELKEKARNEKKGTFWIYPSNDKGKYRLKHWLYHLDLNCKSENLQNTKMFLKDIEPIELKGMSKEEAKNKIEKLWALADGIKEKMQPIFPDAAWEYINNTGSGKKVFPQEKRLLNAWGKFKPYSQYEKMITADAESFKDLNMEKEFIKCSEDLFEDYNNYKIEGNKNGNA
jgi:exonuclease V gamma subunit